MSDGDAAEENTKAQATLSIRPLLSSSPLASADAIVMRDLPAAVKVRVKSTITIKIECAQIYCKHLWGPIAKLFAAYGRNTSGGREFPQNLQSGKHRPPLLGHCMIIIWLHS